MQELGVLSSHLISGIVTNRKTLFAGTTDLFWEWVQPKWSQGCWGDSLQLYHSSSPQPDIPEASQLWFSSSCGCAGSPYVSLPLPASLLAQSALAPGILL